MKRIILIAVVTVVTLAVIAAGVGTYHAYAEQQQDIFYGGNAGRGGQGMMGAARGMGGFGKACDISSLPTAELSDSEKSGILYMVEEEQMARDLYNAMFTKYGVQQFSNIAQSEQMHVDAVMQLVTRYNLTAPALTAGKYSNATLQQTYDTLLAQGSKSLADALNMGGLVEETDINDLRTRMNDADNADIQFVYSNLLRASQNHLRAYANQYTQQSGSAYTAQVLSADEITQIMSQPQGRGMHAGQTGQPGQPGMMNGWGKQGGRR